MIAMREHLDTLPNFDKNKIAGAMSAERYVKCMQDLPKITLEEYVDLLMADVEEYEIPAKGLNEYESWQLALWCLHNRFKPAMQSYYTIIQSYNNELQHEEKLRALGRKKGG
jgi:hypothetical protein